ncbi:MAG TPA: mechanosensitive ion channel family protein [Stellaceae bacterium]|nr:mechanosensitive ion channel family protein [Stellaceae bacterium]
MAGTSPAARRPIEGRTAIAAAIRAVRIWFAAVLIASAAVTAAYAAGGAAPAAKSAKTSAEIAPPSEIQALLSLLADPKVQAWLMQQDKTESAAAPPAKPERDSPEEVMSSRVEAVRDHITAMTEAIPGMPAEFEHAKHVFDERLGDRRPGKILTLVAAFVGLGFGVDALFRRATRRIRENLDDHPVETVGDRVRVAAERAAFALGSVVAFALGSIGAFLALHWPGLLRDIVLGYLIVFLAVRFTAVLGRFLLAPYNERFRVIPMDTAAARYWHLRWRLIVGWIVLALVTRGIEETLGISPATVDIVGAAFGFSWLAILMEAVWRRPVATSVEIVPENRHLSRVKLNVLLTAALVLLWGLRVAGAMPAFWLLAVVIVWPLADRLTRRAVEHLLRPPGTTQIPGTPTLATVFLERGLRAVLIIGAIAVLAWGWGIDIESLAGRETMMTRMAHGALSAVAIALIADFVWHVAKAAIDIKLAETADLGLPNSDEARRRARLRTLLPIFRNILFVVVVVVAIMMGLSAMGVEIGPLIAGASVIGVAIGFGAQSLVRDVIAGVFYLLDDAFRVGEYIQSGNYKGTVESFSFRSVRLRHQRGAVYTVPFSLLGAVQNQSRDWVIDKLTVGITYDSDIERARKLIKQIGLELAEEPEFKPLILEPLKMQGVDAFGDFAVQIRMKMMTLPGENFVIRRQALARIKKAFDANGIKFAYPTVQLAGDGEASAAAVAQQALQLTHPTAAAAE